MFLLMLTLSMVPCHQCPRFRFISCQLLKSLSQTLWLNIQAFLFPLLSFSSHCCFLDNSRTILICDFRNTLFHSMVWC